MSVFLNQSLYRIEFDFQSDISAGTSFTILYEKPDGVKGSWEATLVGGETDKIEYNVEADDLDVVGGWKLQAKVRLGGLDAFSDVEILNVLPNIE